MTKVPFSIRICKKLKPLFPSEAMYLKARFRLEMGYSLNLKHPKTFSEKIQWLKLYNRRHEYTTMVDKYAVKDYVAKKIGAEFVIPTLGVWKTPEEIEWDKLPDSFVLKTTHGGGSGGVVICHDKAKLNKLQVVKKLKASLRQDIAYYSCEWPYKNVPRRIIAEKYISDSSGKDLLDYKWYCFNGVPYYCQMIVNRSVDEKIVFYDTKWQRQAFYGLNPKVGQYMRDVPRPVNLETQIEIAKKLSAGIPFTRIDLYEVEGKTFFGEITLFPASGFGRFIPSEYNEIFGGLINLPINN